MHEKKSEIVPEANLVFALNAITILSFLSFRARLTATAEREAVEVFSRNLKKLFLAPPVRGKNTIGIDPGFKHGCKVAALDCHGILNSINFYYMILYQMNFTMSQISD